MIDLVRADSPYLDPILDASYPIWHEGLSRRAYGQWWDAQQRTAWARDNLRRYALIERAGAEDDGRVLASAKRYAFGAVFDGESIRVMGVGAVFTQPDARGRGHARALLERMLDGGAQDGFDAALLFSEIGSSYYERCGFATVPLEETTIAVVEKPGAPATLVRAGDERDFPSIAAINTEQSRPYRFHLDRPAALVQFAIAKKRLLAGLGPPGAREAQFFVAEEGAAAVAYVVITVRGDTWTLEECGDRDPAGARVGAILQVLLAREPAARRPTIVGWLPPDWLPPQARRAARRPIGEIMMVRFMRGSVVPLAAGDVQFWHSDLF